MFQRIYFTLFLLLCLAVSFLAPAPGSARTNLAPGVADEAQSTEFLQTIEIASGLASHRIVTTLAHIADIPNELGQAFNRLRGAQGFIHFLIMMLVILCIPAAGYGLELIFKRHTTGFYRQIESIPQLGEIQRFWSAILRIVTDLLGLFIFTLSCVVLFLAFMAAPAAAPA